MVSRWWSSGSSFRVPVSTALNLAGSWAPFKPLSDFNYLLRFCALKNRSQDKKSKVRTLESQTYFSFTFQSFAHYSHRISNRFWSFWDKFKTISRQVTSKSWNFEMNFWILTIDLKSLLNFRRTLDHLHKNTWGTKISPSLQSAWNKTVFDTIYVESCIWNRICEPLEVNISTEETFIECMMHFGSQDRPLRSYILQGFS